MINHFLKLGGVNTVEEFYRKFPTEAHFDNHVYKMKYGGMYAYDNGGGTPPRRADYMDNEEQWQADMDAYTRSLGTGPAPKQKAANVTTPAATTEAAAPAATSTSSPYGGVSVVDLLVSKGKAYNKASRKKLAETLGMKGYTGSPSENKALINAINANPEILDKYEAVKEPVKKSAPGGVDNGFRPYVSAPNTASNQMPGALYNATPGFYTKPIPAKSAPVKSAPGVDNGFRPYAPNEPVYGIWPYDNNNSSAQPTKQNNPADWKGRNQKGQQSANIKTDTRNLESGMIEDKNKGVMHVVIKGKVVKTIPIMTGLNKNGEINDQGLAYMQAHPEEAKKMRATPTGTYFSQPNPDIYGHPGFNMNPIPAFGQPAPKARDLAQHIIYPKEAAERTKIMKGPGEKRVGSWGCTNLYGQDIDCLTGQLFPKGDTTIVVDSRRPEDQKFLKNKYNIQKMGGEPCYECGGMYARGGQTLHPGGDGTYYQGNFFDDGGSFVPDYGAAAYGQLPQYEMGMAEGGPIYSDVTQYNHQGIVPAFDWMQDGGSPLYSTQGQQLRNFMNTVGYTPGGWMPNHIQLPPVGPRRYDAGGMSPDQAAMMAQQQGQQGPPQGAPQQGGGIDPQQVMQVVAQKLQQGEQPNQIMQELVQAGISQDMAQQIIQQVMQQMQGAQGQQAAEEQQENPQQQSPQEEMAEGTPQAMYGMGMKYGGSRTKKYEVGGEYEMNNSDIKKLISQGYKIEYI